MTQDTLFDLEQPNPWWKKQEKLKFNGAEYDPQYDDNRLSKQIGRVWECVKDGAWRTLREIADATGDPEASVSAQLRHLRKPRFGKYDVERRSRGDRSSGLWEYRLNLPGTRTT